ncbi:SDR family oxidoreductase [Kutzneria viridogrisea]|uniref:NAD(P)-dependent dehydrogenase (Short-subunit alcohol dehydrogenase family) n=1 Tax=Kutzneria viridogrisea TaxID=47990 RepID=A0ABR6BBW7_9PSEU|nr:NAD(P)-dependent dehydrogenase (short-subunit alcohol dehydrogenase family) [Kutzneria viridogrisea]
MSQVVVITGASGGVGRATAKQFGARGDHVALLARGNTGLNAAAEDVRAAGGVPLPIEVDVADPGQVDAAATRVEAEFGPIDVWVNNAFSSVFAPVSRISAEEYRRVTEVSYLGYVHGTQAALWRMRPRGRGAIVQVGSALAHRAIPLQSAYCAAKHAVKGFTEALRCELLHERSGVHVTMVHLPAMNTPQFDWLVNRLPRPAQPVPPVYQPEVAARAIVHAARHPRRREYWVGASTVTTVLGSRFAGVLVDRYLARTGYDSQQCDRTPPADEGNLWRPADGPTGQDHGAHGAFDATARPGSRQWWFSAHRGALIAAGTVAAVLALMWRVSR